jgi:hypothetical protein
MYVLTGNNAKMAMRAFGWARTLGINFFITGVTQANISIGVIAGRAESPATLKGATLTAGDVSLVVPAGLRGGGGHSDYIECESIANASSCRSFDADGHPLDGSVAVVDSGAVFAEATSDVLSVQFNAGGIRPRLEVTVMERSDGVLGPFATARVKTDDSSSARSTI